MVVIAYRAVGSYSLVLTSSTGARSRSFNFGNYFAGQEVQLVDLPVGLWDGCEISYEGVVISRSSFVPVNLVHGDSMSIKVPVVETQSNFWQFPPSP